MNDEETDEEARVSEWRFGTKYFVACRLVVPMGFGTLSSLKLK